MEKKSVLLRLNPIESDLFFNIAFPLQIAKEQGAVFAKDIWSETDEFGTVRSATVKTVNI